MPGMPYSDGIRKRTEVEFGGYNKNRYAQNGGIVDMKNMSSREAPLLTPRLPRKTVCTVAKPNGMLVRDGVRYLCDGTTFSAGGVSKGTVTDTEKRMAVLGQYLIVFPDKVYYRMDTGTFGSMEAAWTGAATIKDGTYAGEAAEANEIQTTGAGSAGFRVGDAVTISGCVTHPVNNRSLIIREISGNTLRFYENSFVIGENGDTETLTIRRDVPDMDFLCENENRLWGCKGDTIYASKLGDPLNFSVYDGLSTDSFAVDVGSAGDFTACYSYLGYPCFFKEDHIYKVYGDKPSNFQVMGSASLGVAKKSDRSLAVAGEVLFYLSRVGVVSYSGGIPQSISDAFGVEKYRCGVAGSDGERYMISMQDTAGNDHLFVYDTRNGYWMREDNTKAVSVQWDDGTLYCLTANGVLWADGNSMTFPAGAVAETAVASSAEFNDFTENDENKKGTAKIQMRVELEAGASLTVEMQFDSDGIWRDVATLSSAVKRSYYLPIIPRRSDHFRIRLSGNGMWRLYSLTRESYSGSEL